MNRRSFLTSAIAAGGAALIPSLPGSAAAQSAPDAATILRQLKRTPQKKIAPNERVTIEQLKRAPQLRRLAPSIEIQSINFAFGSSRIPARERWKIEQIAIAMRQILHNDPREIFLIEGHTDAVGSRSSNYVLSQNRAYSVANSLIRHFGIPMRTLEPVGYGEDYLLVPTTHAEWRNRRVTLRRVTDFVAR